MTLPGQPTRFSAALELPFTPRTWPSRATADASSRTGPWRVAAAAEEADRTAAARSSTCLPAARASAPPPPPPRSREAAVIAASANSTGIVPIPAKMAAPLDPQRLANLFSYRLTDDAVIAEQKLSVTRARYAETQAAADAADTTIGDAIRQEMRRQLLPLREKVGTLLQLWAFHEYCSNFSRRVAAFEEVVVQCLVRDTVSAAAAMESDASAVMDRPIRSALSSVSTFVGMEMALLSATDLLSAETTHGHTDSDASVSFVSMLTERWKFMQERLRIGDATYYDVLDILHAYGLDWSRRAAFATFAGPGQVHDEANALATAAERLNTSSIVVRAERVLTAQRSCLMSKTWLTYAELCNILSDA